jgi:hypothetical protein
MNSKWSPVHIPYDISDSILNIVHVMVSKLSLLPESCCVSQCDSFGCQHNKIY